MTHPCAIMKIQIISTGSTQQSCGRSSIVYDTGISDKRTTRYVWN